MSDDSIVLLQCPGHELHEGVDDLPVMDDFVMAQFADAPVCTNTALVVTDRCAPTLSPCVEDFHDDQPQDSLGSMGPVEERDVAEEQAEDVQVFHPSLFLVVCLLGSTASVLYVSFV
jgi:hypothetical protein